MEERKLERFRENVGRSWVRWNAFIATGSTMRTRKFTRQIRPKKLDGHTRSQTINYIPSPVFKCLRRIRTPQRTDIALLLKHLKTNNTEFQNEMKSMQLLILQDLPLCVCVCLSEVRNLRVCSTFPWRRDFGVKPLIRVGIPSIFWRGMLSWCVMICDVLLLMTASMWAWAPFGKRTWTWKSFECRLQG